MERLVIKRMKNLTAIALAVSSISSIGIAVAGTSKHCDPATANCTCAPTPSTSSEILTSVSAKHKSHKTHAMHVKHQHHHVTVTTHKHRDYKSEGHHDFKAEKRRDFKGERHRDYKAEAYHYSHSYMHTHVTSTTTSTYTSGNDGRIDNSDPFAQDSRYTKWYTTVGAEYYAVNLPTYRLPITFGRWVPTSPPTLPPSGIDAGFNSANSKAGNTTIMPFLGVGYNLANGSTFLPNYFDHEAIEFGYSQFNRATKDLTDYAGATGVDAGAAYGVIWRIDNTTVPMYNGGAVRIVESYIHASAHYHNADLYVKANIKNLPSYLTSTAKIGLVATALDQFYSYNIAATTQGITHDPIRTVGDDSLRARYLGVGVGDTIDFKFAKAFSWFATANVQGLYAMTRMTSNQVPDEGADPNGVYSAYRNNIRVNDSKNNFTFRAHASTGLNFYPKTFISKSPLKVSGFVGVDQWGYVPQEATITSFGASTPHIGKSTMRNYFVGVSLTMAIA